MEFMKIRRSAASFCWVPNIVNKSGYVAQFDNSVGTQQKLVVRRNVEFLKIRHEIEISFKERIKSEGVETSKLLNATKKLITYLSETIPLNYTKYSFFVF
jgi:hypothetical protein